MAVPLGLLIGLPALRLRGVNLAVVTLAAAFAIDALVFNDEGFSGGLRGRDVPSPTLFGCDLGIAKGDAYPRVHLRRLRAGRRLPRRAAGRAAAQRAGRAHVHRRALQRARRGRGRASTSRARSCSPSGSRRSSPASAAACSPTTQQTISPPSFAVFTSLRLLAIDLRRRRRADRGRGRGRRDALEHRPAGHRAGQGVQHRQVPARSSPACC